MLVTLAIVIVISRIPLPEKKHIRRSGGVAIALEGHCHQRFAVRKSRLAEDSTVAGSQRARARFQQMRIRRSAAMANQPANKPTQAS
jgi:hypothetical protein